jgi:hypothetical protein
LFSAVRATGRIDGDRFEIHRKLAKIRLSDAREIIEIAEEQGYVDVTLSAEGVARGRVVSVSSV